MKSKTTLFIEKANNVHNYKFNYNKTIYINSQKKIIITCPIHGDFEQTPNKHLSGINCTKCSNKYKPTLEEIIINANKVHKNKYDYKLITCYKSKSSKVDIVCPEHGVFSQRIDNHLFGSGCPECTGQGFFSFKMDTLL